MKIIKGTISKEVHCSELTEVADCVWVIDGTLPKKFCDDAIRRFEADDRKVPGKTASDYTDSPLDAFKKSTDLMISYFPDEWKDLDDVYYKSLWPHVQNLAKTLEHVDETSTFSHDSGYQMQRTKEGEYYKWHSESFGHGLNSCSRTLTFMTYLNDNFEGGHTGFTKQKIDVQPKAGRLVLFLPYWSHTHCGHPVVSGSKYVITGWIFNSSGAT